MCVCFVFIVVCETGGAAGRKYDFAAAKNMDVSLYIYIYIYIYIFIQAALLRYEQVATDTHTYIHRRMRLR